MADNSLGERKTEKELLRKPDKSRRHKFLGKPNGQKVHAPATTNEGRIRSRPTTSKKKSHFARKRLTKNYYEGVLGKNVPQKNAENRPGPAK